jgi:hypothetical protein
MKEKLCVYTVLLGKHELLNEQPVANNSQVDFICFTDDRELVSQSWKLRYIEPVFTFDLARSSRIPKICPHRYLPEYSASLYIDNTIVLKKTPEAIFQETFENKDVDFVCANHPYRETVLDEFIEVTRLQYDDLNIIAEQLNAYFLSDPEVLGEKPLKGGFLIRNHHNPVLIEAMEEWLAHVLRYSRRDQLSLNYVLKRKKVTLDKLNIDFLNTDYFDWLVVPGRNQNKYKNSKTLPMLTFAKFPQKDQDNKELMKILEEKENTIRDLEAELKAIRETRSWKLIQPLRTLWASARRMRHH